MKLLIFPLVFVIAGLLGCGSKPPANDGEVALPSDYTDWPVFVAGIEKSSGHIRDIYVNNKGAKATKGDAFPDGTQFVMAIYNAKPDASGKLAKDGLAKVFLMTKGEGYGQQAAIKTGDWVYSAFDGDGKKLEVDYNACRACHVPLANTDYVFHYDQYFNK